MHRPVLVRALYVSIIVVGVSVAAWTISRRIVEQRLTDDATTIALASSRAIHQQLSLLDEIPAGSADACDPLFVTMLDRLAREHPGVAGVFVQQPGEAQRYCSDEGPVTVPAPMVAVRPDDAGTTIGAWVNYKSWEDLLYFSKRRADGVRAVLVKPIDFLFLATPECADCRRAHFELVSSAHPLFRVGNRALEDRDAIVKRVPVPELSMTLVLAEEKSAVWQHMRAWAWLSAVVAALLIILVEVGLRYRALKRRSLASLMAEAVLRDEFLPHYQAIIDIESGRIAGCEVLIRWLQDDGVLVPPSQFIETLERSGHIIGATETLIETSLADLAPVWADDAHFFASINVVPEHLESGKLERYLGELQARRPFPASWLAFEVTERLPIRDLEGTAEMVGRLRDAGYCFELDDVGTGYGGFSYLQRMGFEIIKLDKMFVDTIGSDDIKLSLVPAIVAFARDAGLEIIAEGVERPDQVAYLRKLGVRLMQGYFFARPMAAAEFVHYARLRQPLARAARRAATVPNPKTA